MSHFIVAVVLPKGTDAEFENLETTLAPIMAPFNEQPENAPERETPCTCASYRLDQAANAAAVAEIGDFDAIREAFGARTDITELRRILHSQDDSITNEQRAEANQLLQAEWKTATAPFFDAVEKYKADHAAELETPDADCDDCKGSGITTTSYPLDAFDKAGALIGGAKWDWYTVGGRWTGFLTDYEADKDPRNIETCNLCGGSGTRTDRTVANGCNGCGGTGKSVKWSLVPYEGDLGTVAQILDGEGNKRIPFAVLLPDGRWCERGEMGWFGCVSDEKDRDAWADQVRKLLEPLRDRQVVVVDCHI